MSVSTDEIRFAVGNDGSIAIGSRLANRHGLVAGATGTGKTITLRVLTENFSDIGVPVFLADVKGDLSGLARPGGDHPKIVDRVREMALADWQPCAFPVVFWDVFGEQGHPVRTTVSEMGPLLLARLLNLNETQAGVLSLVFRVADDQGLLLLDLKDLRSMVQHVGEQASTLRTQYGNVSAASIGAIQRGLLALEEQDGERFFGEPALDLADFLQTAPDGRGMVNILAADRLLASPRLYATFLLWLLAELFEALPEVGDPDKPKLVFFFDEAHLLFSDAPRVLREKVAQVVRLVRSKGVGVYFVTQNPLDLPEEVLGQLGNRVQHALRAFTPRDQKGVRSAAETFRPRPGLDTAAAITELGTGEALVSVLDEKGMPTPVDRARVLPPRSRLQPLSPAEREQVLADSLLSGHYERSLDRQSAYEVLQSRAASATSAPVKSRPAGRQPEDVWQAAAKSAARAVGSQIGRQIVRGVLGALFGGRRR